MKIDVIVIGAGASGLTAAIAAAEAGASVCVLERLEQPGKKILATGNGRCNFTNTYMGPAYYRGQDLSLVKSVLERYSTDDIIHFFRQLGIYPRIREGGYCYPYAMQASAILQVLINRAETLGVQIHCGEPVDQIARQKQGFRITTKQGHYQAARVILAAGGKAYPKLGSDGSGYVLARQMGHTVTEIVPALTGLKCQGRFFKRVSGVRVQAKVSLVNSEGDLLASDEGELQMTAYGISGIPVFQVSRYAAMALSHKQKVYAMLDFMPEFTAEDFMTYLCERKVQLKGGICRYFLTGLLPEKLIPLLLTASAIDEDQPVASLSTEDIEKLVLRIKQFRTEVIATNSFDEAQVCAGGIVTREIDPETMMSRKVKGLYIVGELLDVDGMCGGYNLHFAWATGLIAGHSAGKDAGSVPLKQI